MSLGLEVHTGLSLSPSVSGWNPDPKSKTDLECQRACWHRSHLLLVLGLRKAGPAPSAKGKEAICRGGQSAHGGSCFLLPPKSPSRGGLSETLEEPQDTAPDGQEGPAAAEIPPGSCELVAAPGLQAIGGDSQLRGPGGCWGLGQSHLHRPLCGHIARKPLTAPASKRQR